jgi:hypothetical protein
MEVKFSNRSKPRDSSATQGWMNRAESLQPTHSERDSQRPDTESRKDSKPEVAPRSHRETGLPPEPPCCRRRASGRGSDPSRNPSGSFPRVMKPPSNLADADSVPNSTRARCARRGADRGDSGRSKVGSVNKERSFIADCGDRRPFERADGRFDGRATGAVGSRRTGRALGGEAERAIFSPAPHPVRSSPKRKVASVPLSEIFEKVFWQELFRGTAPVGVRLPDQRHPRSLRHRLNNPPMPAQNVKS